MGGAYVDFCFSFLDIHLRYPAFCCGCPLLMKFYRYLFKNNNNNNTQGNTRKSPSLLPSAFHDSNGVDIEWRG